jgi:hypothetical protein
MGEDQAIEPLRIEPLAYSTGELNRRPGLVTWVAILSILYASILMFANGARAVSAIQVLSHLSQIQAQSQAMFARQPNQPAQTRLSNGAWQFYSVPPSPAYWQWLRRREMVRAVVAGLDLGLGCLLLVGAILLLRASRLGSPLMWGFAVGKLALNLLIACEILLVILGPTDKRETLEYTRRALVGSLFSTALIVFLSGRSIGGMAGGIDVVLVLLFLGGDRNRPRCDCRQEI